MRNLAVPVGLLSLLLSVQAFGQSTNATVSGTVQDPSGALVPGVTITATNNDTGVVTTVLTNEAGAYNFASLLPGVYKVSAALPGFQTRTFTDVQLGNAERLRLNFTLGVSRLDTAVEVMAAADTLLTTSSSSVGGVLSQSRLESLPNVANNVMDFYRLIPGVTIQDNGVRGSFAGLEGFGTTNIQRDGVDAAGGARWTANALTATHMNPDLIGELKVVIAPVDAELGRGNAQLQFLTRSGTNRFHGSAVWNVRNSAFDANTWSNNNDLDPVTGQWSPTAPDWHNVHNFVGSYGGPIVRNKTFFFALYDQALVNIRTTQNPIVLTPCARNGIFRFFDGWNNGNALQVTTQPGNATPTIAVVDGVGNPKQPATDTVGGPFMGQLRYASVFGTVTNTPTQPDCSDAIVSGSPWDLNRTAIDSTGFVSKLMGVMPSPNNYEVGDGLNTAGHRWVRREKNGNESIFALDDEGLNRPDSLARKQINLKIDHNFNQAHKLSGTYTYEHSYGVANFEPWPEGFRGQRSRRPQLLSVNFTSTLTPNLVNEFRSGMRRTGGNSFNGLEDPDNGAAAQAFFPNYGGYPTFIGLGTGQVNFQTNQMLNSTAAYNDVTSQWSWADTLSWTRNVTCIQVRRRTPSGLLSRKRCGRGHDFAYLARSAGTHRTPRYRRGRSAAPIFRDLPEMQRVGNNQRMRNLLSFLAGSLSQVTQFYYMQDPNNLDAFESYLTLPAACS